MEQSGCARCQFPEVRYLTLSCVLGRCVNDGRFRTCSTKQDSRFREQVSGFSLGVTEAVQEDPSTFSSCGCPLPLLLFLIVLENCYATVFFTQ